MKHEIGVGDASHRPRRTVTTPAFTWEEYERDYADRHLLHQVVAKWARERPDHAAIIEFDTGREISYRQFDDTTTTWALRLIELGYRPGDYLATMLPLTVEHILLEYACFKIGVVHAPLDTRLKADEVIRSLGLIQAKGFVMPGRTPTADYTPIADSRPAAAIRTSSSATWERARPHRAVGDAMPRV